jgi:hypothetical protein
VEEVVALSVLADSVEWHVLLLLVQTRLLVVVAQEKKRSATLLKRLDAAS